MKLLVKIMATGFGSGYSPYLPGTTGSLVAAFIAWHYSFAAWKILLISLIGVLICGEGERILGQHDSPHIVFDEFCGILLSTLHVHSLNLFIAAFFLFRFFDMLKPYPINRLQALPGGWGIMADDLAAGVITRILLSIFQLFPAFL